MSNEKLVQIALGRIEAILLDPETPPALVIEAAKLVLRGGKPDGTATEILNRQLEQIDKTSKADQEAGL